MRKNLIAMSVAAFVGGLGMAGGATAAVITTGATATGEEVRQSGTGHQLIVPYFNTQVGNATLFNIVNTDTVNGKAVKVRFRGASNSDDVFDFQLFLSPGDVWAANISRGPNGVSRLTTIDKSCTLPAGVGAGTGSDFVTARLPQTLTGDDLAAQTREGYIEVFNMADIPPNAAPTSLFTAIKHVNGVAPCTSTTMATLATDTPLPAGLTNPSTGIFANWTLVNVPKSGSATGEAVAITATIPTTVLGGTGSIPGLGNIVFFPQVGGAAPTPDAFTADPLFRTTGIVTAGGVLPSGTLPIVAAQFFDLPDLSTPYLPATAGNPRAYVNLLSTALATSSITNEFLTDTSINAFTDWTFSSPTRRYAVVADYRPLSATPAGPAAAIFDAGNLFFGNANVSVGGARTNGQPYQICTTTGGVTFRDREETSAVATSFVISPNPPAPAFVLCGEVSVLTFNSTAASVLGASIARTNFTSTGPSGIIRDVWASVPTPGLPTATAVGGNSGLPIVGKAFSNAATGTFNLGGSWEHRYVPTFPR